MIVKIYGQTFGTYRLDRAKDGHIKHWMDNWMDAGLVSS